MIGLFVRQIMNTGFGFVKGEDGTDYYLHTEMLFGDRLRIENLIAGKTRIQFDPFKNHVKGPRVENPYVLGPIQGTDMDGVRRAVREPREEAAP